MLILTTNGDQFGPFYYDSTKVESSKIPHSYADVLDPYWKGKIVLTYPNDDDGVLYLFKLIIERQGWTWLDQLLTQDIQWVRGASLATGTIIANHSNPEGRVMSFSGLGGFTPATDFLQVSQPQAPEQFMTWAQQAAIFSSTKKPETAKLLASFLLSDAWQKPVADRGAPVVRASLSGNNDVFKANNTSPLGYIEFMADRATVEWWRMQIETYIGLAVGPNPAH